MSREDLAVIDLVRLSYSLTDDQMLWAQPVDVMKLVGIAEGAEEHDLAFIADLLARLRNRRLFVKSLAVRASYPSDPWSDFPAQKTGLQRLVESLANPIASRTFRDDLVAEVQRIVGLVPSVAPAGYDTSLISHSIVVVAKSRMAGGTEIDRSFIFHGGKPITYRDLSGVNRHAWADVYDFSTAPAMVFCPREIALAAFVGAERLIREQYDVILPASAVELSKQDDRDIRELKKQLQQGEYYHGSPFDLRARPSRLDRADVHQFLDEMTIKLEAIDEAPAASNTDERWPMTLRGRIEYWLSQFQSDALIECAMKTLRALRVLSREDTREALKAFVVKYPQFAGATVLILGSQKDSSSIQGYYSQDAGDLFPRVMTVEEAATKKITTPVVFLDDFIGSGNQVRDVLGNWFEDDSLKTPELEEQRDLFGEEEREFLRAREVGFVFVAGWQDGVAAAEDACKDLGLRAVVYAHLSDDKIPFAFDGALSDVDQETVADFKAACQVVGRNILLNQGKPPEVAESRALGYGNRAMLLVSRYNLPTQVLTCLWRGGSTGDFDWQPLLHRRAKQ